MIDRVVLVAAAIALAAWVWAALTPTIPWDVWHRQPREQIWDIGLE
jgi:hypothetical protein